MKILKKLFIIITIIALISCINKKAANSMEDFKKYKKAMKDMAKIRTALKSYYRDNGEYPDAINSSQLSKFSKIEKYIGKVEVSDPWGSSYFIESRGTSIFIGSAGPDKSFRGFNQNHGVFRDLTSGKDLILKDFKFLTAPIPPPEYKPGTRK